MAITGIDEDRLRHAFLEEAEELSQKLGDTLLALEADQGSRDLVNEVFRLIHSLKSESALMGFDSFSRLAHGMEDVLGKARDGDLALTKPVMDAIFSGSDLVAEMLGAIAAGRSDADSSPESLIAELARVAGRLPAADAGSGASGVREAAVPAAADLLRAELPRHQLGEARDRGESLFRLTVTVDEGEPMKFPRAYLVFNSLEMACNVLAAVPPMDGEPAEDSQYARTTIYLTSREGEEALRAAALVDQIAKADIERLDFEAFLSPEPQQPGAARAGEETADAGAPPKRGPAPERTSIRVDTRKLDDLWSLIADLVLHKSHIARLSEELVRGTDIHAVVEGLSESFDSLDKISGGMQQAMMDTRMIPISVIFNKFPRLVRDLSRKLGKSIELVIFGEDTEIDRSIVEALSDPLTHLIRNSIDHGIEFPEERVRHGKPQKGRVSVSARRQGGTLVIEIADDGRGLDSARIREKALAQGIPGAASLSESDLLDLVFLPGFSTKEVVTDLSGRGVGMDVVASRVRGDLKGDVFLKTDPGRGARITLVLPTTLTIVNALLVRGDTAFYAIPLTDVDSTTKILNTEIRWEEGRETCSWLGNDIPLYRLGTMLERPQRREEEHFAVVVHHGELRGCLVVDELMEEREIVIKPIDDLLNPGRLFSGVSVLEDGRPVFILDTSFVQSGDY